jgi:DNA-binding IclR family transcriptional regulator
MVVLCVFVKASYQMPMTCCMSRLTQVMPAQHTAPSRIGLAAGAHELDDVAVEADGSHGHHDEELAELLHRLEQARGGAGLQERPW